MSDRWRIYLKVLFCMSKNSLQFFGLPGSGKTTILKDLVKNFPDKYKEIPKFGKLRRLFLFILFCFRFPYISLNFIVLIFQNNRKILRYVFHLVTISFASHMYIILSKSQKVFLIDEGIAQRLLSVAYKKYSLRQVKRYKKFIKKLSCPVVITEGGNFGRFEIEPDRMTSYRNLLGEDYYKNWSENLSYNFDLISKEIRKTSLYFDLKN